MGFYILTLITFFKITTCASGSVRNMRVAAGDACDMRATQVLWTRLAALSPSRESRKQIRGFVVVDEHLFNDISQLGKSAQRS